MDACNRPGAAIATAIIRSYLGNKATAQIGAKMYATRLSEFVLPVRKKSPCQPLVKEISTGCFSYVS